MSNVSQGFPHTALALLAALTATTVAAAPPAGTATGEPSPIGAPLGAGAGHAIPVRGQAWIEHAHDRVPLRAEAQVQSGDSLVTGSQSNAQLNMADGAIFALQGDTTLRIDQYVSPQNDQDTAARSFYSLLRGGFRTVTGLIGKLGGQNYQVATPMATLGVKGTEYLAIICKASCFDPENRQALPDGLYEATIRGAVSMANPAGSIVVGVGQAGYTPNNRTRPVILNKMPAFLIQAGANLPFVSVDLDIRVRPPRIEPIPIPPEPPTSPS